MSNSLKNNKPAHKKSIGATLSSFSVVKKISLISIACLLFSSCSEELKTTPQVEKYGIGWDSVRRTIGLPPIKGNLTLANFGYECLDPYTDCAMFANTDTTLKPRLFSKKVFWDSAGINLERNYFIGPNNEVLQISYGYKKFSDWTHIGFGYGFQLPHIEPVDSFTKRQTDSVLASWNIHFK